MDYTTLRRWGYLTPYFRFFGAIHWLHPEIHKPLGYPDSLLTRALLKGIQEGDLYRCKVIPWLAISPAIKDSFTGRVPSNRTWTRILEGPQAHESMIHRVASRFWFWPGARLLIDEAIREPALPPAWGGFSVPVPDVKVLFDDGVTPPLWIECERGKKRHEDYARKLGRISGSRIYYIVQDWSMKGRLDRVFEKVGHGEVTVLTEAEWHLKVRAWSQYRRRKEDPTQLRLGGSERTAPA